MFYALLRIESKRVSLVSTCPYPDVGKATTHVRASKPLEETWILVTCDCFLYIKEAESYAYVDSEPFRLRVASSAKKLVKARKS